MSRLLFVGIFLLAALLVLPAGALAQQPGSAATSPVPFLKGETTDPVTVVTSAVTIFAEVTPTGTVPSRDTSPGGPMNEITANFQSLPAGALSDAEMQDIVYLLEEEKLQRDLYGVDAQQFPGITIFASMQQSAASFMTADDFILAKYGITSSSEPAPGIFNNPQLQAQYNSLISQGGLLTDTLAAAAQGEELHIADLTGAMSRTDNPDLQYIYNQELALSRNNLRALASALSAAGKSYTPRYLTTGAYNAIIASPMEKIPSPLPSLPVTPIPTQPIPKMTPTAPVPTATPVPSPTPVPTPTITQPVPMPYAVPFPPRLVPILVAFQLIPSSDLSSTEISDITYLQEAQKLERDLYIYLSQQSPGDPLFASLAQSASVVTKADDGILARYNITSPEQNAAGQFSNPQLQALYQLYTGQSGGTVPDALLVAAQSEDQHIASIYAAMGNADNADLQFIYRQQLAFSSNNLRAINQQLGGYSMSYTPQYLSQAAYNAIVTTPIQTVPTQ